jgi:hypothetical protein
VVTEFAANQSVLNSRSVHLLPPALSLLLSSRSLLFFALIPFFSRLSAIASRLVSSLFHSNTASLLQRALSCHLKLDSYRLEEFGAKDWFQHEGIDGGPCGDGLVGVCGRWSSWPSHIPSQS